MNYIGTKTIVTERLKLRKINKNDYKKAYKNWCSIDEVVKYVTWSKHNDMQETKVVYDSFIENYSDKKYFMWLIELKDRKEPIGTISVSRKFIDHGTCEIGYCIGNSFWNNGYMTEAVQAVISFLFDKCNALIVCAEHLSNNPASGRVMQKCNMKCEGTLRSRIFDKDNIRNDLVVYSITKEEYLKTKINKS